MSGQDKPFLAVCGKGGVGKTVVCALLSRALRDDGGRDPFLLIDADPVGGLTAAIGESDVRTLGDVREDLIASVRDSDEAARKRVADDLDYRVLEALVERDGWGLFSMGRKLEKGCFCPVNSLLRSAIDVLSEPFAAVLIDAEAGIEQINRQVTRRVNRSLVVIDGSARSIGTLELITDLLGAERVAAVLNRHRDGDPLPDLNVELYGAIPEDDTLRRFDREARPLWELPADNPALAAAREVARAAGLV